jgi:N-acetylglutamate synthase-like GNAT family acetyltransferase
MWDPSRIDVVGSAPEQDRFFERGPTFAKTGQTWATLARDYVLLLRVMLPGEMWPTRQKKLISVSFRVMQPLLIRRADPAEQKQLEELQLRASLTNAGDRDAILAHPDAIEVPLAQITAGRTFVAEWNGVMAGFAALEPREDGESELDALFVAPDMRRRGIGRSLIEYCAQVARTQGSAVLYVIGNPHAEQFYVSCGFTMLGTSETRFGPGLVMRMKV